MRYKLVHHTAPIVETTWWKDQNRMVPSGVWWLEGPGISRPATDVEVEFWKRIEALEAQLEIETKGAAA